MKRSLTWTFRITLEKTPQGDRERTWIDLLLFDQLVRNIISQHVVDHWIFIVDGWTESTLSRFGATGRIAWGRTVCGTESTCMLRVT